MSEVNDDPFANPPESDDPFADPAPADPAAEVASTPVEGEQAGDIPVVDKEGNPVEPPAEAPAEGPQAPAEADVAQQEQPEPPNEATEVPETTADDMATPEPTAPPAPSPEPEAPAPQEQTAVEPQQQNGTPQPEAANGKSPMRFYKVLFQTGPSDWSEADLKKAKEGGNANIVDKDGGLWLAARNNEHAVRLSWGILGAPAQGVTAFPVPMGAWKPRRIKPAPPRPERERLEIS